MWFFLFFCDLLVPFSMLVFGRMLRKHPPKDINSSFGYRTKRSMRNQESWDFAQVRCGSVWQKTGWILLVISILVQLPFWNCTDNEMAVLSLVLCACQVVVMLSSIYPVERALKKEFEERL